MQPYFLCQCIIYNLIMLFVHSNRWCGLSCLKFNICLGLFSTQFYHIVSARERMFLNFSSRAERGKLLSKNTFYSTLFTSTIMPPPNSFFPFSPSLLQKWGPLPKSQFSVPHMSHTVQQIRQLEGSRKP